MKLYRSTINNNKYEIYDLNDDVIGDAVVEQSLTLVGTVYGTRPQQIDKVSEAQAIYDGPGEGFSIFITDPSGIKKDYILKRISSGVLYKIINDPEDFDDSGNVELIVEKI